MGKPVIAIVGRPNVGKSTLFNRIVGRREAIVADMPGTTRDRIITDVSWEDHQLTLVDTGGLEPSPQDVMRQKVKAQVEQAVAEADLLIFLVDGDEGLAPMDEEIARWLRRQKKPLIMAVNKVDNFKREQASAEFYRLGLGEPMLISAYHNLGVYDLMEKALSLVSAGNGTANATPVPRVAIVGRTNVGKSTLVNAILGQERAIVSEVAGTTRDSLDTPFAFADRPLILIDTAGIRRRGQVQTDVDKYSVLRAMRTIERCDIAILLTDATELATAQDAHVFGYAWDAYKGLIAVVNKWDLVPQVDGTEQEQALQKVRQLLHFMPYVPILFTSALKRQGLEDLLRTALELYDERQRRVSYYELQSAVSSALSDKLPPVARGRKVVISSVRQVDVNPPTFLFAVNSPDLLHFSYRRYLENRLRVSLGFRHTRPRLVFKKKGE